MIPAIKDLIIHSVYQKRKWKETKGTWTIAYEFRGEWKPKTEPLMEFLAKVEGTK